MDTTVILRHMYGGVVFVLWVKTHEGLAWLSIPVHPYKYEYNLYPLAVWSYHPIGDYSLPAIQAMHIGYILPTSFLFSI